VLPYAPSITPPMGARVASERKAAAASAQVGHGVLVDVDGTLIALPSTEVRFAAYLARTGLVGAGGAVRWLLFLVRWAPRLGPDVFKKDKAYLAGLRADTVADLAETFVREAVVPRLRPALLRRLEAHRAAGEAIALVTGAPDFIARALAPHVGAETWAAAEYALKDGVFVAAPPTAHPLGEEKVAFAKKLCAARNWTLEACAAYGDSVTDAPLLGRVARPVAVCPDRALARIARARGWEILVDG